MISEEKAKEILSRPFNMKNVSQDILEAHRMAIKAIEQEHTRKVGKWVKSGQSFVNPNEFLCYSCSECGLGSGKVKTKFCPNCGAKMKED